jgi:hypothetical protein
LKNGLNLFIIILILSIHIPYTLCLTKPRVCVCEGEHNSKQNFEMPQSGLHIWIDALAANPTH